MTLWLVRRLGANWQSEDVLCRGQSPGLASEELDGVSSVLNLQGITLEIGRDISSPQRRGPGRGG